MYQVKIIPKENLGSIIPLLQILNPKMQPDVLEERFNEMKKTDYQCVGVYSGSELIAISGIWILQKIYAGKHIEPDNVIVHPDFRNKGIGELLMDWIHQYARDTGCIASELNCYVHNEGGNKFWKSLGYEIAGYHYIKKLTDTHEDKNSVNSCLS